MVSGMMRGEGRSLVGFSINAEERIELHLKDGTRHTFATQVEEGVFINALASARAIATTELRAGQSFIACPARGASGICFVEVPQVRQ
jgi:hypothetical protein